MTFFMALHICVRNLHLKSLKNRCALRVTLTLKTIITTILATLGPFLGTLELSDLAPFFTGAQSTPKALPHQIP